MEIPVRFVFLNVFVLLLVVRGESTIAQYEEMCGNFNGRRIYVELGKNGTIIGGNNNTNIEPLRKQIQKFRFYNQCKLELISCPACIINVKFKFLNIPQDCNKYSLLNSCNCDHLWVYEPSYQDISGKQFCGQYTYNNNSLLYYKSKTRTVELVYFGKRITDHSFLLEYSSERNHEIVQGYPAQNGINETHTISTPYFPHLYPFDLNTEYTVRCNVQKNCRVCLVFTDFLISKVSVIEILDWNGKRLEVATGMTFRPATVISSGPSITIRFYANGATNKGFKVSYFFLSEDDDNKFILKSNMNCGGVVDNLGGGITMMDLVKDSKESLDCVWIFQPSKSFLHFYTHLYLKVVAFSDFAGNAELWIHEGITSSGQKIEILIYPSSTQQELKQNEHVLLIPKGFYVRFKGLIRAESKLAVAYTAFSNNECIIGTDFLCKNQRCIPIYLQCDGFDHCGDNSDEPVTCFQDAKHRRWSHATNFFFPKSSQYTDLHIAAIIFLICCFGLVALIIALIVLIFRINGRVHQQRQIDNHLQTISDLLDEETSSVQEEIIEDDPPDYEPPPNYNELINDKIERHDRNKKISTQRSACSRCSKRLNISPKESSIDCTGASTSGTFVVPNSPPPNYNDINHTSRKTLNSNAEQSPSGIKSVFKSSKYTISIKNITESKQNFFAKHFSHDDSSILKRKVLQKSKKQKKRNKNMFMNDCETNLNLCLSDSELSEINPISDYMEEDRLLKLQRSFSFDGDL